MWRCRWLTLAAAASALAGCGHSAAASSAASRVVVDDATVGYGENFFRPSGHWEHVRGVDDGRSAGTSTRSTHRGAVMTLLFSGTAIRLHGILGPTGGLALATLDDERPVPVDFYAPGKRSHATIWARHGLPNRIHVVTLMVLGMHDGHSRGDYVNLDDAVIESAGAR